MIKRLRRLKTLKQTLKKIKASYTMDDIIQNSKDDNFYKFGYLMLAFETLDDNATMDDIAKHLYTNYKHTFKTKASATRFIGYIFNNVFINTAKETLRTDTDKDNRRKAKKYLKEWGHNEL